MSVVRSGLWAVAFIASASALAGDAPVVAEPQILPDASTEDRSSVPDVRPVVLILPETSTKSDGTAEANGDSRLGVGKPAADGAHESFARSMLARSSNGDGAYGAMNGERGKAGEEESSGRDAGIPGAIVSVIFGIFGLLVIGRRRAR